MTNPSELCLRAAKILGMIRDIIAADNFHSACESLRYAAKMYGEAAKLFHDQDYYASAETALSLQLWCTAQAMQIEMDTKK